MSRIISPTLTLTITVDNRVIPARADLRLSQDMPIPAVVDVLLAMAQKLNADLMRQITGPPPGLSGGDPGKGPGNAGGPGNGNT